VSDTVTSTYSPGVTSKGRSLKDLANKSPLVKNSSKSGIEDLEKLVKLVRKYWN
jgi:hypothetical protein